MRQQKSSVPACCEVANRRRHGRWGLAAWCTLGLACGLSLAACAGSNSRSANGAPDGASLSHQLRQKIEAAQDPAGYLVKTTMLEQESGHTGSSTVLTVWTDLATGNAMMRRGNGSVQTENWERDFYDNGVLHWDQTEVNYGSRTWWTADDHAKTPVSGRVPKEAAGGGYAPATLVDNTLAAAPTAEIVGHPGLGGVHTIELSTSEPGVRFDLWVDNSTYRLLRSERHYTGAMHIPTITFDYYWVRASAAMVNLINHPHVPAGFTQVHVGQR
jgi:hypothetical protein